MPAMHPVHSPRFARLAIAPLAATAVLAGCSGSSGSPAPPDDVSGTGDAPGLGADPLLTSQWHLDNTGQNGATVGEDANVPAAWGMGVTGSGVRIAIIDGGLEIAHPDISYNSVPDGSYSYVTGGTVPTSHNHGTSCAGVAAAVGTNARGVSGAAYEASLVGFDLLQASSVGNEADAMIRTPQEVDVSSNSWGPADTLGILQDSNISWRDAIESGITAGRGGRGIVYTWAAGNGAQMSGSLVDDSNYDGYANHHGVISVAAVGDDGTRAFYSEKGANVWIAAPSLGNSGQAITTTDLTGADGYNADGTGGDYADADYTNTFNGTSSSTPLVSGTVALMLERDPNLSWSDVRWILAETARQNDPTDADWSTNGAGFMVNHSYGFGVVDAAAAVTRVDTWTKLGALTQVSTDPVMTDLAIPDNDILGVSANFNVAGVAITSLEYVYVYVDVPDHDFWPDLRIEVTSPSGTVARLCDVHNAVSTGGIVTPRMNDWRFGVARFLGEDPNGTWTINATDLASPDAGTLNRVRFEFFGR